MPLPAQVTGVVYSQQLGALFWSQGVRGFEGQIYAKNPHNTVWLKGLQLPGKCEIKALPTQDYGREKAPGRDGGTLILQGYLPGPIDIAVTLWLPKHWEIWHTIVKEIWRRPGRISAGFSDRGQTYDDAEAKKAAEASQISKASQLATTQAIEIVHPALQDLNIHRVVVSGISLPEPGPAPQSRIINIKCLEFVDPPAKTVTARAKGAAAKPVEKSPLFNGLQPPSQNTTTALPSATG